MQASLASPWFDKKYYHSFYTRAHNAVGPPSRNSHRYNTLYKNERNLMLMANNKLDTFSKKYMENNSLCRKIASAMKWSLEL